MANTRLVGVLFLALSSFGCDDARITPVTSRVGVYQDATTGRQLVIDRVTTTSVLAKEGIRGGVVLIDKLTAYVTFDGGIVGNTEGKQYFLILLDPTTGLDREVRYFQDYLGLQQYATNKNIRVPTTLPSLSR